MGAYYNLRGMERVSAFGPIESRGPVDCVGRPPPVLSDAIQNPWSTGTIETGSSCFQGEELPVLNRGGEFGLVKRRGLSLAGECAPRGECEIWPNTRGVVFSGGDPP